MKAKITKTGPDSAVVEPIVLRPGQTTRLVFKALVVNNKHDELKPVRGDLVWQRRKPSEQEEEWIDESHLRLTSMTAGSGVKLELTTDELYLLTQAVRGLYGVYWSNRRRLPRHGEEFELADYAQAAKTLDTLDDVARVADAMGHDQCVAFLKWIASNERSLRVLDALPNLDLGDLTRINPLAGIGMLRQALSDWRANKGNDEERFWQDTLRRHAFVFSQVFSTRWSCSARRLTSAASGWTTREGRSRTSC